MAATPRTTIACLCAIAIALTATALAAAPPADGKVWFGDLGGERVRWGAQVTTTIAGCAAAPGCGALVDGAPVVLRRDPSRGAHRAPADGPILGRIDGRGRLTFRVPKVHAGAVHLAARLPLGAARRWMNVSATFRILAAPSPRPAVIGCESRSTAEFPDAYTSSRNVVERPLVLIGAAAAGRGAGGGFRGDKLPVLVAPRHRVTIQVAPRARAHASLFFARGGGVLESLRVSDGRPAVTFAACAGGTSRAGSRPVSLWTGFLLADAPMCVPLRIWIDDAPWPTTRVLRVGAERCR